MKIHPQKPEEAGGEEEAVGGAGGKEMPMHKTLLIQKVSQKKSNLIKWFSNHSYLKTIKNRKFVPWNWQLRHIGCSPFVEVVFTFSRVNTSC